MRRGLPVALCVLFLVGSVGGAGVPTASAQEQVDPDDVSLSVSVGDSGDAEWTVEYRTRLDSNESEAAFEEFREDLESDPGPYRERFHRRMNATAADASNATGREMAIRDVSVRVTRETLPREYGVVTWTFEWTNFAAREGDRLVVGDAVDALFLDEETSLYVSWPTEYGLENASPSPSETREGAVLWNGPRDFAEGEPRVVVDSAAGGDDRVDTPLAPAASPFAIGFAVLLAVGAIGIGAYRVADPFDSGPGDDDTGGSGTDGGGTDGDGTDGGEGRDDREGGRDGGDGELLTNEEQVLRLVEERGGRMKQADVAEELGWTAAKTSQVTTELRERGELEAFRLGRENVLERPDESS